LLRASLAIIHPRESRGWIIASEARNNAAWYLFQIGARDDAPRAKSQEQIGRAHV